MNQRPVMIFHVAYPLNPEAKSASGIRPVKMRRAFEEIGYDVIEISGRHPERRARIAEVKRRISGGLRPDFVYSEAATPPTGLGEPVTLATSLTRDIRFLRFCRESGIPVGLFYRDVYWQFPIYDELVRRPISTVLRMLYRRDLRGYRRANLDVYLPSLEMRKWVPIVERDRFRELPPGCELQPLSETSHRGRLRLLYVGGLGNNYRLHDSVAEIAARDDVELTICTREAEWELRRPEYADVLAENIRVVHASGDGLKELYEDADATLLAVEPIVYWSFAVPMKLLESVGYGKPVIASDGSFSGRFAEEQGIGWSVEYGSGELGELVGELQRDRSKLEAKSAEVVRVRENHTWAARARQVAQDLEAERATR